MPYSNLHDGFHDDPDLMWAGLEATAFFARMISYCGGHMTDGFVPESQLRTLAWPKRPQPLLKQLIDAPAKRPGANPLVLVVDGGVRLPNYLKHNRSRDQIIEERQRKAAAEATRRQRIAEQSRRTTGEPTGAPRGTPRASSLPFLEDLSSEPVSVGQALTAALGEKPPLTSENDPEVLVDLTVFEDVLDHDKRHLLRSICRSAPQFAKLKPAQLARIQAEPHGGPVLLEALRSLASTEPADLASVRSPAKILDARVGEVLAQMGSRSGPKSGRETAEKQTS
jgi:hypothetical protein